jgi:hypothetical protein
MQLFVYGELMRTTQNLIILAGVLGLNIQLYVMSTHGVDRLIESVASAMPPVFTQAQPEEVQRKLDELDRLRASNAALQAVVMSLSGNIPSSGAQQSGQVNSGVMPGATLDTSLFPVLPMPSFVPTPDGPAPRPAPAKAVAKDDGEPEEQEETPAEAAPVGQLIVTPIRILDNGAMVYLASDKVVRVVAVNGRIYGVDGVFLGEQEGVARLSIKGREISLPFIVSKT